MEMIRQAVKYGIVGGGNTLISLAVIWLMTKNLGCSEALSNFVGYLAGLINSFFLNRWWTFKSKAGMFDSALKFFLVFAVCFSLQFGFLLFLNRHCPYDPPLYSFLEPVLKIFRIDTLFYIQMLSMVMYTVTNFMINKYYTFNK
ncbi:MAG: GtrA family protein [Tannerella sp.]|jgi:putative flippase GtrA|nr:GtrA family protein [Tannerella sp.]